MTNIYSSVHQRRVSAFPPRFILIATAFADPKTAEAIIGPSVGFELRLPTARTDEVLSLTVEPNHAVWTRDAVLSFFLHQKMLHRSHGFDYVDVDRIRQLLEDYWRQKPPTPPAQMDGRTEHLKKQYESGERSHNLPVTTITIIFPSPLEPNLKELSRDELVNLIAWLGEMTSHVIQNLEAHDKIGMGEGASRDAQRRITITLPYAEVCAIGQLTREDLKEFLRWIGRLLPIANEHLWRLLS